MSIVRNNLLNLPNYSPYCGGEKCHCGMPRTIFNEEQFECACGWQSGFDDKFIAKYIKYRKTFTKPNNMKTSHKEEN